MKKLLIILALLVTIPAYGGMKVKKNFSLTADSQEGVIVVSTRTDDQCRGKANSSQLIFSGEPSTKVKYAQLFLENTFMKKDFKNPPGYLIVLKLPAGKYQITKLTKTGARQGNVSLEKYKMGFTVSAGKISYLGEIHGDIPDCGSFKVSVKDEHVRDGKLLEERFQNLKAADMEMQIIKPAQ